MADRGLLPAKPTPATISVPRFTPEFPVDYWHRPVVLGDRAGQLNFPAGGDRPFTWETVAATAFHPDGLQWHRRQVETLRWALAIGTNSLTIQVKHTSTHTPRPTLRLKPLLHHAIPETVSEAGPDLDVWHSLTLQVTVPANAHALIQLEWLGAKPLETCIWRGLTFAA